jgi:hypothetical protein
MEHIEFIPLGILGDKKKDPEHSLENG